MFQKLNCELFSERLRIQIGVCDCKKWFTDLQNTCAQPSAIIKIIHATLKSASILTCFMQIFVWGVDKNSESCVLHFVYCVALWSLFISIHLKDCPLRLRLCLYLQMLVNILVCVFQKPDFKSVTVFTLISWVLLASYLIWWKKVQVLLCGVVFCGLLVGCFLFLWLLKQYLFRGT